MKKDERAVHLTASEFLASGRNGLNQQDANKPSKANESSFLAAVDEVAAISTRLLHSLETTAPPKNREEEAAKAKARAAERFGA